MIADKHTYYSYDFCVGAYFEMPTSDARRLLPGHLQPLEVMHERSILAITAFDFHESEVGAYSEVVMAVVVPPIIEPGRRLPKAAFFPFIVGTNTATSRHHAIERWRLPHYMEDLDIDFRRDGAKMEVTVKDDRGPAFVLHVTSVGDCAMAEHVYTCFTVDPRQRYKVDIVMQAEHEEHEEEEGMLELYDHPMTAGLTIPDINTYPFREEWYGRGLQTFDPMTCF